MRRIAVAAVLFSLVAWWPLAAAAQTIGDIEEELRADQVVVESGAEGDESELRGIVADAADAGLTLYIVSIAGSSTDAEALANSLRGRLGGTVLVVTPDSLGASSATLAASETNRGLDAFTGSIEQGSAAFVAAVAQGSTVVAANAETTDTSGSAGGSSTGFWVVLLVLVGGAVGLFLFVRSRNRKRVIQELATRREAVTEELGAIGQEILLLADRVQMADNAQATQHFRDGNEQYLELQDQLDGATSLWQVTEVDYAADTAAWHLDAAEALLDGEPVPDEPERPDLEVSRPPAVEPKEPSSAPQSPSRRVEPRQRRRTQWDPPRTRGGGMGDLLSGVLVGDVLRGGGRTGRRAPGRWSGGGSLGGGFSGGGGFGGSSGSRSRGSSGSRRR